MKNQIEFTEFLEIEKKLDIKWGSIIEVTRVPKSKKLLQLEVAFGEEKRIVVTNIGDKIENEQILKWQKFPFVMNLIPTKIMGIESTAMIMPSITPSGELYLQPDPQMGQVFPPPGSKLI